MFKLSYLGNRSFLLYFLLLTECMQYTLTTAVYINKKMISLHAKHLIKSRMSCCSFREDEYHHPIKMLRLLLTFAG